MTRHVLPFVLLLGLLPLACPGSALAGDDGPSALPAEGSPSDVAEWILSGDDADVRRAVRILERAPSTFLFEIIRAIRNQEGASEPAGTLAPPAPQAPETEEPRPILLQVYVRVLDVEEAVVQSVLDDAVPDAESPARLLDAKEVLGLLGRGRRGAHGVKVLGAPRLTTLEGQPANVSILKQTSYVRDFEVHRDEAGNVALEPIVEILEDGLIFDVTARITEDGRRIALESVTTWTDLKRPMAEFKTTLEGRAVTLQIPELMVARVRSTFDLPPGGYALIGGLPASENGRRLILLHASVVPWNDLEQETHVVPR